MSRSTPPTSTAFQRASPVVLSSSCDVALGSNASPNMTELSYPYRKAVLIDEIRFDMWATDGGQFNMGAFVYAKFQLGQHYLMRDPVPVWLLGTLMDRFEEEANDTFVNPSQIVSHYRWKLPEPLYVEAGQVLRPTFNRVATLTTRPAGNITVQVSYAGRVVAPNTPRPGVLAVPYVAPFVTTFGVAGGYQQSNEYHLFNPFDRPLKIQRLTGRLFSSVAPGQGQGFQGITPVVAGSALTVQIYDSWGGKLVNDLTGPGDVFDTLRAAWTIDTVMPAKGQYDVRAWNIPASQQLHVAMIGTREEAL